MDIEIINKIADHLYKDCSHLAFPQIVREEELKGCERQDCEMEEFEYELVNQAPGGGISGDSYVGFLAFPLGEGLVLRVEYYT